MIIVYICTAHTQKKTIQMVIPEYGKGAVSLCDLSIPGGRALVPVSSAQEP